MRRLAIALAILPFAFDHAAAQTTLGRCFDRYDRPVLEAFDVNTIERKLLMRAEQRGAVCRLVESKPPAWLQWKAQPAGSPAHLLITWDFSDFPAAPALYSRTDPERASDLLRRFYTAQGARSLELRDSGRAVILGDREWRIVHVEPVAALQQILAVRNTKRFGYLARLYKGRQEWSAVASLEWDGDAASAATSSANRTKRGR